MPAGSNNPQGNVLFVTAIYQSITPAASVGNATYTTSTYTINGLVVNDIIDLYPQSALTTTLSIGSVWVGSANTLSVQWINSTAGSSSGSPAAISFIILVNRATLFPYTLNSSNWPTVVE
jgi:hypothetical protein